MLNSIVMFRWPEAPFLGKSCSKDKLARLSWNLVTGSIKYAEFDGDVNSSCFGSEIQFLGKFSPKYQSYLLLA